MPESETIAIRLTELTAAVTGLDAKIEANQRVQDEVTKGQLAQLTSLDRRLSEVRLEVADVRKSSGEHLLAHSKAPNPHPEQEKWIREHDAALGKEINRLTAEMRQAVDEIRTQVSEWRGSLKILTFVGAPLVGVISGAVVAGLKALT